MYTAKGGAVSAELLIKRKAQSVNPKRTAYGRYMPLIDGAGHAFTRGLPLVACQIASIKSPST